MGYFDRRSYYFTNENRQEFVTTVRAAPLMDLLCFFRFGHNGSLEIVAQREDFPKIEEIIQRYGGQK